MRVRNILALLAAALLAGSLALVPAQAKSACPPACTVSGSVVGSVIQPGPDFVIHGTLTDGSNSYFFKVEGPYNFIGGNLGRGTVKIEGPGAPRNLKVAVAFEGSDLSKFTMHSAAGATGFASGNFSLGEDGQLTSDNVTVSSQAAPSPT